MKLSLAESITFIAGTVAAMVTFTHRLRLTVRKKISKKAYKRGHYAIAFLLAGVLELLFCVAFRNVVISIGLNEKRLQLLMLVSGGTTFVGVYNMVWYYVTVSKTGDEE